MWPGFARICLCPCFTGLLCFFEISVTRPSYDAAIKNLSLSLARFRNLYALLVLSADRADSPMAPTSVRETHVPSRTVSFRCSLEEWHSRWLAARRQNLQSCTVGLERFERWRGRFGQRRVVLLHRRKRFTEMRPEPAGDFAQCAQHIFFFSPPAPVPLQGPCRFCSP